MKKTIIKSIISLIILFSLIVVYGSLIGGNVGILQFIVLAIITFVLLLFSLNKSIVEKSFASILFACFIISGVFMGTYYWINNFFDSTQPIQEYQIEISDLPVGRNLDDGFFYYDNEGNEVYYSEFRITPFDFEIGDTVNVQEFDGAFGVKHYKFDKVK